MRTERINISTPELDEEEHKWWNINALTIEKIWAQTSAMQNAIRKPYLNRMKKFFQEDNKNQKLSILEVGCGSGWVCRTIASENIHIIGTDFSEEQLKIATQNAKKTNKDQFCKYELADASTFQKNFDGVVIHAVLHHLSKQELKTFFEEFRKLKSGTKVFFYEPLFFNTSTLKASILDRIINRIILFIKSISLFLAKKLGSTNAPLNNDMNKIFSDAEKNGWYISPKEVPFYEGELESYFDKDFKQVNKYIVNRTELDIAQSLTLNSQDEKPSFIFTKILIPISRFFDNLLYKGNFRAFIPTNSHLFVCFELIKI